jgi:superfamily II DNA or RNA helicase
MFFILQYENKTMSRYFPLQNLTNEEKEKITAELNIEMPVSRFTPNAAPKILTLFDVILSQDQIKSSEVELVSEPKQNVLVPFSYRPTWPRPERSSLWPSMGLFTGQLRPAQEEVATQAIQALNQHGAVIIACQPGFGKTCLSIYLSCKIKLCTLVICHYVVLINQWKESLKKFCPTARVHIISGKKDWPEADIYLVNAINVPKYDRSLWTRIGTVIVDECHLIMADKLSMCLRYLQPRYLLGLSATPYRVDGLNILLRLYFGPVCIERELWREHYVYPIYTKFKWPIQKTRMGQLDWNAILDSQSNSMERNDAIVNLVRFFSDRVFLILCKRVSQAQYLHDRLKETGEDVTSLFGATQTYEQSSRILVGTAKKTGVGFDHPRLNALVLAADIQEYFVQYLGRVFRREDTVPIIFDIVDNFPTLRKHFSTRVQVYTKHGGIIRNIEEDFAEFSFTS